MRMICNKAGLTYWADTDNNDAVLSPYFEDEEDAILWYGRVAEIMFEEFDVNKQGIADAIVRVKNNFGVEETKGWVCPRCGVDRTKTVCPQGYTATIEGKCPMIAVAQ